MPEANTEPGPSASRWRAVAVGTAVALALLAFFQVVSVGAMSFAVIALLYAFGAMVLSHGRPLGLVVVAAPSLVVLLTQGRVLLDRGVLPGAYDSVAEFLIAVAGVPLAALNLTAAALLLANRRR